jgi:O-acetyl-ADP-ribose deacetylase (regulator of RNase III)
MIEYTSGDIFTSTAQALVNPMNCVGVMGKGLALQFKHLYPANYTVYARACRQGQVQPGRMLTFELDQVAPRFIINFPTKRHWRDASLLDGIEASLAALIIELRERCIGHVALPPLSCGLGGLSW